VFAHGYGVTLHSFAPLANRLLAQGRRVVLFDQRGHGESTIGSDGISSAAMASDCRAVLEQLGIERGVLVGHSMGGFLALRFLLTCPDVAASRVAHAVLVSTLAGKLFEGSLQNRLQVPLMRYGLIGPLLGLPPFARSLCRSLAADAWTDAMMEYFVPVFRASNHRQLWPIIAAMGVEDLTPELPKLRVPCTLVVGDADRSTPIFHSRDMARRIPQAELVVVPGAKHSLNIEALDLLTDRLLALTAP